MTLHHTTVAAAEHWIHTALGRPAGPYACTLVVPAPSPHVLVSLSDPPVEGSRAVIYPGVETLVGEVTVAHILAATAIDRVVVMGSSSPTPDQVVLTRDFVRPLWTNGVLTLTTQPAWDGLLVPFETPNPTPCCADH